jgi:hypothetical protein
VASGWVSRPRGSPVRQVAARRVRDSSGARHGSGSGGWTGFGADLVAGLERGGPHEPAGLGLLELPAAVGLQHVIVAAQRSQISGNSHTALLIGDGVVLVAAPRPTPTPRPHTGAVADLDVAAQRSAGQPLIEWASSSSRPSSSGRPGRSAPLLSGPVSRSGLSGLSACRVCRGRVGCGGVGCGRCSGGRCRRPRWSRPRRCAPGCRRSRPPARAGSRRECGVRRARPAAR